MRLTIGILAGIAFLAAMILNYAGLAQLAVICASGGCGLSTRTIVLSMAIGAGALLLLGMAAPKPAPAKPARRPKRAAAPRKSAAASRPKRRAAKAAK